MASQAGVGDPSVLCALAEVLHARHSPEHTRLACRYLWRALELQGDSKREVRALWALLACLRSRTSRM